MVRGREEDRRVAHAAGADGTERSRGDDIVGAAAAKQQPGGDMMIFASPTLSHALSAAGLIDEWRLTGSP